MENGLLSGESLYYVPTFLYITKDHQKVMYFGDYDYASIKDFIVEEK